MLVKSLHHDGPAQLIDNQVLLLGVVRGDLEDFVIVAKQHQVNRIGEPLALNLRLMVNVKVVLLHSDQVRRLNADYGRELGVHRTNSDHFALEIDQKEALDHFVWLVIAVEELFLSADQSNRKV